VRAVFVTICAVAIPFYLRFLVAVFKECRYARICYLLRIEPTTHGEPVVEGMREESVSERAA
jgi:hypothetical protein